MTHSRFTVDTEGKDTWRHREAGADIVASISENELAYIERRESPASFEDLLEHIPSDIDILVCEGLTDHREGVVRVVAAREAGELKDTFVIRGIKEGVVALTGIMANDVKEHPEYPVFNCLEPADASALADLILDVSGSA